MRVVHLLAWPAPGAAMRPEASAAAAVASAAIARRGDVEHLVFALGPSVAGAWAGAAGLPGPIVQMAPPTGKLAMAGPAVARALRAAGPVDVIQAWSPGAGAVARRVRPAGARVCAAALSSEPAARRWLRAAPAMDALVTPCPEIAARAGRACAAARIIETAVPRARAPARRADRAAARARLGLGAGERAVLLIGDGADAARFIVACALTGASGRPLCAILGAGAGHQRRALRTFERSRAMLDCRLGRAPWPQLAAAADIGMIVEDGDVAVAAALGVAIGLGLPVIAPAPVYGRLGVRREDAPELVGAAWTRAELARLAGPLLDDPRRAADALGRARAATDRASGRGAGPERDFFDALDEVWAAPAVGGAPHTIPA